MTALQRQKRNIEKGKKQTGKPNGKLTEQPKLIENQNGKVTDKKSDVFLGLLFEMDMWGYLQ